jgi:hypothetical protein
MTETNKECIDYLVLRRFPQARLLNIPPSLSSRAAAPHASKDVRDGIEAYRRELRALTYEELTERYQQERMAEAEEARGRAERQEQERFFNQPLANADFAHWSKAMHWTLDEALALSFGKAPESVTWENVKPFLQVSPFAFQYGRRRDLALRALQWEQLFDPVLPSIFLAWAKRTDIPVPTELTAAVEARGVQIGDWKNLYEEAKRLWDECRADLERHQNQWLELNEQKDALIKSLQERIATLEREASGVATTSDGGKEIGPRERDSLLKLVIGMAVVGYRYEPKAERSTRVTEIASDLASVGIQLDADTVRKWLRVAAELLPGDYKQTR